MVRLLCILSVLGCSLAAAVDVDGIYREEATWAASMAASKAALKAAFPEAAELYWQSGVVRGGEGVQAVTLDVRGIKELRLKAGVGPDDYHYDRAVWVAPVLIGKDGQEVRLETLQPVSAEVGWGKLQVNQGLHGEILVKGVRYTHGLFAHAPSVVRYELEEDFESLEVGYGIDGTDAHGSVVFSVEGGLGVAAAVWGRMEAAFPEESRVFAGLMGGRPTAWFYEADAAALESRLVENIRGEVAQAPALAAGASSFEVLAGFIRQRVFESRLAALQAVVNLPALRASVAHLCATYGAAYPQGAGYLEALEGYEALLAKQAAGSPGALSPEALEELLAFRKRVLLDNPCLDFEEVLMIRRDAGSPRLGLPQNWQGNCALPAGGYSDELIAVELKGAEAAPRRVFKPRVGKMIADIDLHFEADKLLFSMRDKRKKWQIYELAGLEPRGMQLPRIRQGDAGRRGRY